LTAAHNRTWSETGRGRKERGEEGDGVRGSAEAVRRIDGGGWWWLVVVGGGWWRLAAIGGDGVGVGWG